MKNLLRMVCGGLLICCVANAFAAPDFGTFSRGSDLEPEYVFLSDGGAGSVSASVNFSTFRADAAFDALSTYLPILRAESRGLDATFDDDRTQAEAQAYQAFTSSVAQTIRLDITLDSIVTNTVAGTSSVLSNIYVIGGSDFAISDGFCSPGQFTFDGVYLCGDKIATSSTGLNFSNLFNDGANPNLIDYLVFDVAAGESFGVFGELSAGSFQGTADAFNTLSLQFDDDEFIEPRSLPPSQRPIPEPPVVWLIGVGLAGILGVIRTTARH